MTMTEDELQTALLKSYMEHTQTLYENEAEERSAARTPAPLTPPPPVEVLEPYRPPYTPLPEETTTIPGPSSELVMLCALSRVHMNTLAPEKITTSVLVENLAKEGFTPLFSTQGGSSNFLLTLRYANGEYLTTGLPFDPNTLNAQAIKNLCFSLLQMATCQFA